MHGLLPRAEDSQQEQPLERQARSTDDEPVELPSPKNATPLFENTLRFIEGEITYVADLKEILQGNRFVSEAAGSAEKGTAGRTVSGGQWFPNPALTRLIGSCLVEYDCRWETVERLLKALHWNPAKVNRAKLDDFLHGRDGLMTRIRQIAFLIRGGEIKRGRKPNTISAWEHYIALAIGTRIEAGHSEEDVARSVQEKHGLSPEEYSRLRDLARGIK